VNLFDYWTIEYSPTQDAFHVGTFPNYLGETQKAFYEGREHDWILLGLHPTRVGANDECEVWKERRNKNPIDKEDEAARILRQIALYFGESVQAKAGVGLLGLPPRPDRTST
jgi:hypothetical protein